MEVQENNRADETGVEKEISEEGGNITNSAESSTSNDPTSVRDKCIYGVTCYRRSLSHKEKFSHPGDSDYDLPDNRPECKYGMKCYRKNAQHRQDFKHTQQKRKCTKRKTLMLDLPEDDYESSEEESVDESDEYIPSDLDVSDDDDDSENFEDNDISDVEDDT